MNYSICLKQCRWFSPGHKGEDGISGGYGCTKYSVASHCIVSQVNGVSASPYELVADEERQNELQRDLISMGIASLGVPDKWEQKSIDNAYKSRGLKSYYVHESKEDQS